ncbi:MAG: hopanoid biosynthesis-associated protein HpnK [Verrucomicrobia bacterium]|nr:hopanoid biosynthesis-associated protein HpnK [Verrucomicrobiota bacterium]
MARPDPPRRLVVNADDFGRSTEINQAVIRAHREGILTTASLMVNGRAVDEAVELAKENPNLGVGLHLTLLCGRSALKPTEIPGLVDKNYEFTYNPVVAGCRYFFRPGLRPQLRHEMAAQFQKFRVTGLRLDHVNGHLHMHLHPTVFSILRHHADEWGITHLRLTRDPFWLNARIAAGHWFYRVSHAVMLGLLSWRARPHLDRRAIRHTGRVFGLLQNARVDESYVAKLLPLLPAGDSELYSHPSLDDFKHEFDALVSPRVKSLVDQLGIRLIRYQDL